MNIGFIGLGNIGRPMARQLFKLNEPVWVYDVVPAAMGDLAAEGARAATSPAELAAACHHIGLCVRDDRDVEALLYGDGGILDNAKPGTVIAIHSTVTQAGVLRWARDAAERELKLFDAAITGGATGAENARLCYMVGGDEAVVKAAEPVFMTSGEKVVHAGPLGSGIALKLCNNLMTYLSFVAIHEAANLAQASGLELDNLRAVGESNGIVTPTMYAFLTGRNGAADQGEKVLEQAFGAFARLGHKDLEAALESGRQLNLQMPGTECAQQLIEDVFLKRY